MKKYISPSVTSYRIAVANIMQGSPVTEVTGADDLGKGDGDFAGGAGDSKRRDNGGWDEGGLW